jgi:hypothetical protein
MKAVHHKKGGASITFNEYELELLDSIRTFTDRYLQNVKYQDSEASAEWYDDRINFLNELKHKIGITA